jgi:hypothetical protein
MSSLVSGHRYLQVLIVIRILSVRLAEGALISSSLGFGGNPPDTFPAGKGRVSLGWHSN